MPNSVHRGRRQRLLGPAVTALIVLSVICRTEDQAFEQEEADSESIWIQAAFWPTRQTDTEPFFEVTWPTSKDADGDEADAPGAEHVVVPPSDRYWAAQFTIAETIEQFPDLIAPSDVLSLEIRQIQDSDTFVIILEVDDQSFNVTRAVHYLEHLVGADRRLADQLLRPTPSGHAFAMIPLDLIDFWRLDMRVVPGGVESGAPVALVAAVSAPDLIASPFFGLTTGPRPSLSSSSPLPPSPAALDAWLASRRDLWRMRPVSAAEAEGQDDGADPGLALVIRYLRVVGQYALYAEVVRHEPSPVPLTLEFNPDSNEIETEVILAHWGHDRQLGGRILHVGGGQRRTVSLSSPIWYDGIPHATMVRTLTGTGFHRHLETALCFGASTPAPGTVSLMLMEFLPPGAYIDPDEIERLQRFRNVRMSVLGDAINIEAPESVSKQNVVVLHLDNVTRDQAEPQWLNVSVPIHLRYQRPEAGGQHAPVRFPDPVVFASFAGTDGAAGGSQCPKTGTIWPQPFLVESHLQQCPGWHTVVLNGVETDPDPEARIPCGNSDQQPFVQLVTFLSTFVGACAVLAIIWASSSSSSSSGSQKPPHVSDSEIKKDQ